MSARQLSTAQRALPRARSGRARSRRRRGFTLIEIVVSLGVMSIGALAIIGLQSHTIRANSHARQMAIAMQIAQQWIERFKQDAHTWTQAGDPNGTPTPVVALANTAFLSAVSPTPIFRPIPNLNANRRDSYDFEGRPINLGTAGAAAPHYCVSFRPGWVFIGRAMRVDVRVWWPRDSTGAFQTDCVDNDTDLNPGGPNFDRFHVVYLSTVITHMRSER